MIFPNKNTNPSLSVINTMCYILELIMGSGAATIREVREYIEMEISDDALPLVEFSINLLYLLGKVEYNSETDSLYFVSSDISRKTA